MVSLTVMIEVNGSVSINVVLRAFLLKILSTGEHFN